MNKGNNKINEDRIGEKQKRSMLELNQNKRVETDPYVRLGMWLSGTALAGMHSTLNFKRNEREISMCLS